MNPRTFQSRPKHTRGPRKSGEASAKLKRGRGRPSLGKNSQHRLKHWPKGLYRKGPEGGDGPFFYERRYKLAEHWLSFADLNEAQATEEANHVNLSLRKGEDVERFRNRGGVSFAHFLQVIYGEIATDPNIRFSTRKKYKAKLDLFVVFKQQRLSSIKALSGITPQVAAQFIDWRSKTPVARNGGQSPDTERSIPKAKTLIDDRQMLSAIFDRAVMRGWLQENPWATARLPERVNREEFQPHFLTDAEIKVILKAAHKFDKGPDARGRGSGFRGIMEDSIKLFLYTGMRREELINLTWKHVDFTWGEHGILRVGPIRGDDGRFKVRVRFKRSGKDQLALMAVSRATEQTLFPDLKALQRVFSKRAILAHREALLALAPAQWPLNQDFVEVTANYHWEPKATVGRVPLTASARTILNKRWKLRSEGSPFVFPHPDGGPLRSDYYQRWAEVLTLAGLPKLARVHDLRHRYGRQLRKAGVPLDSLRNLMRHKHQDDSLLYAPYSDEEGAAHIKRIDGYAG